MGYLLLDARLALYKSFPELNQILYQTILMSVLSLLLDNYNGPQSWWQYKSIMIL